jgi:hypothetical protein
VNFRHFISLSVLLFCGCKEPKPSDSNLFAKGVSLGTVDKHLLEASGLVESIANPNHLWTLNDSGNPAEVFLIDQKAKTKLVCRIEKIDNRDFEDIAIGPGPDSTKNYIYVGDIGDNLSFYKTKLIYRFEEPILGHDKKITITQFDTLMIKLPDGVRDTETLMIEPKSNDLYLVSKLEDSVRVYKVSYPFSKEIMIAERVAIIPYSKIVAGRISENGKEVLLKDYYNIYYWKNVNGIALSQLLLQKPAILTYDRENQGEAITWARDGSGYYTLSEKAKGKLGDLLFYKRN